jgi:formamidopyrimidine-DNA glycosylase
MPELPEVEVTRLSFASRIEGAQIRSVQMGKALRWPMGIDPDELQGRVVVAVRRRGKYLLIDLATPAGAAHGLLLLHLGMSGSLSFAPHLGEPGKHDHFSMATTRGILRLNDPRRFGAVVYASSENDSCSRKLLGGLGVEPLSNNFDAKAFHQALQLRKTAIKQVLLAGDVVVGVGNIYCSEALFLAGIRTKAVARCATFQMRRVKRAISSSRRWFMAAPMRPAACALSPSSSCAKASAARFFVLRAKNTKPGCDIGPFCARWPGVLKAYAVLY